MITIQTGSWPGWPNGVTMQLREDAAAAVLTAARDYQTATGRNLHGDYAALPVGCLRTPAEVDEMRAGFNLHARGAAGWQPIYQKYNMDTASTAPPIHGPHEQGVCVDISDNGFLAWLKAGNASRYGLRFTLLAEHDLRHAQFFPGTATAAISSDPFNNQEADMPSAGFTVVQFETTHETLVMYDDGRLVYCIVEKDPSGAEYRRMEQIAVAEAGQSAPYQTSDDDFNRRLWIRGRYDLDWTTVKATVADNHAHVFEAPAAAISGGSDAATLAAIAALDKQADNYQTQLEALIAGIKVPTKITGTLG